MWLKGVETHLLTNHLKTFVSEAVKPNTKKLLFVRSCENVGHLSGTLTGWMDSKLTPHGSKQCFSLN